MDDIRRTEQFNLELRDYIRVLRRQWIVIAATTVVVVVIALGLSLRQDRVYEATARVVLDEGYSRTVLLSDQQAVPDLDAQVVTEIDIMRSGDAQQTVEDRIGYEPDVTIAGERPQNEDTPTRAIGITADASSGVKAAEEANEFATNYIDVRKELITEDLTQAIQDNRDQLQALDEGTFIAQQRIRVIDDQLPGLTDPAQRGPLEAERNRLLSRVEPGAVATQQAAIDERINLLSAARATNEGAGLFKRTLARVPESPVSPQPVRAGLIGFGVGLGLGLIIAFIRDYYDDTIRTKEDLDRITGGVPVLGIIPAVKTWRDEKTAVLESLAHPSSAAAEAYRSFRTSLEFQGVGQDMRLVHITSASPGEGKSATSANLAMALARSGHDVVIVDCDLRRPRLHEFFHMENESGLTTVLLGSTKIEDTLQRVPDVPGLYVLPSGPQPPNPSELLSSTIARTRLRQLASTADYVIIDSPPLLPVTDSVILAGHADATVMVVRARSTNRRSIHRALELLDQAHGTIAGMVLNLVRQEATYGYGYGYGYVAADDDVSADLVRQGRHPEDDDAAVAETNGWSSNGAGRLGDPDAAPHVDPTPAAEEGSPPDADEVSDSTPPPDATTAAPTASERSTRRWPPGRS